jgi:hypothetical protein
VAHAREGRRLLVRVDTFLAAVQELETTSRPAVGDDEEDDVDAVLKRMGRKRIPGGM